MKVFISTVFLWLLLIQVAEACKIQQPPAMAFSNPGNGSCPTGYYKSNQACVPTGASTRYAFFNGGGSCPTGYYRSGKSCVASSAKSCNAFFNNGGRCPNGYYASGNSCVSNWFNLSHEEQEFTVWFVSLACRRDQLALVSTTSPNATHSVAFLWDYSNGSGGN